MAAGRAVACAASSGAHEMASNVQHSTGQRLTFQATQDAAVEDVGHPDRPIFATSDDRRTIRVDSGASDACMHST